MIEKKLDSISEEKFKKKFKELSYEDTYKVLLKYVKELTEQKQEINSKRKLYYISAEFLTGRLLLSSLINLGIYGQIKEILKKNKKDIDILSETEEEPSLGNGGLGRLASCFMDSIASLGLNGDGIGINYHFGLFRQKFKDKKQYEEKDPWMDKENFLQDTGEKFTVEFKDKKVISHMYDIKIPGYKKGYNRLHLFDLETADESLVKKGIDFDKKAIEKNLSLFLYPDDSDEDGRKLRVYQQYFMVSSAAQFIIKEQKKMGHNLEKLYDYAVIQINDTHPAMIIPELVRLLEKENIPFEKSVQTVTKTLAYTNHTILAEALEKWPYKYIEQVSPDIGNIIKKLNKIIIKKYPRRRIKLIDRFDTVHMANMAINFSKSTNGVAKLHTEILKKQELKKFYKIYPEKFNNKTNGITFRRWLFEINPKLTEFLKQKIGQSFITNHIDIEKLLKYKDDKETLKDLLDIKYQNKIKLAEYIEKKENIKINPNSIFDIQIKRLHEYKRQQMNALYVIDKYFEIKNGKYPMHPITVIFGAKAAPAYTIAKDIIHLIKCLETLVNEDKQVNKHMKVIMVTNYNVSYASKLIPAADISEQISLASKEASGTGNMKLMLNGALTLGTMDGANVEIRELVGDENIYIFGKKSNYVMNLYRKKSYDPKKFMKDEKIKRAVEFIISKQMIKIGDKKSLKRLHDEIINKDYFMTLLDFKDYVKTKEKMLKDYEDRENWAKKMLVNISKSGFFSSDRTINQYNEDIWKL